MWPSGFGLSGIQSTVSPNNAIGLVCCPLVDADDARTDVQRTADLKAALTDLKTILSERGLKGFVEPLGFPISTLRFKQEAVSAIKAVEGEEIFGLVHDTFHHAGASDPDFFPLQTGLVHVSAVVDKDITFTDMLDGHREFVMDGDKLDSIAQVKALFEGGYKGYISFEPFSDGVWQSSDPVGDIKASMDYMKSALSA